MIFSVILVITVPLAVIIIILNLPPEGRLIAMFLIVIGWGMVAGYKEWVTSKRKEGRPKAR